MRGGKRTGAGRKPAGVRRVSFSAWVTVEERASILARFGTAAAAIRYLIQAAGEAAPIPCPAPVRPQAQPFEPMVMKKEERAQGKETRCANCQRRGANDPGCPACKRLREGR
jgi:hypothetical protein